jgi:hypothetical protein
MFKLNRRQFIRSVGVGGGASAAFAKGLSGVLLDQSPSGRLRSVLPLIPEMPTLRWQKKTGSEFYIQLLCEGIPLVYRGDRGLLTASWSIEGSQASSRRLGLREGVTQFGGCSGKLEHQLLRLGRGSGEDVLEAMLSLRNDTDEEKTVQLEFGTSVRPFPYDDQVIMHMPLTATGLEDPADPIAPGPWAISAIVSGQFQDCNQPFINNEEDGRSPIAHYLEPYESDPPTLTSLAPLLIPLIDLSNPKVNWRVTLFCTPRRAWRLDSSSCRTRLTLRPNEEVTEKAYLFIHVGNVTVAWRAFHSLALPPEYAGIHWLNEAVVHYYDFLSPGKEGGKRGPGYLEDASQFQAFHVSLATQHGYYPFIGDYINPDRRSWLAMRNDPKGPVSMSIDDLRTRIRVTRANGSKAAIYMHQAGFDTASPLRSELVGEAIVDRNGKPMPFYWVGPDTVGRAYVMSVASPVWRRHFLQQVEWIMEILDPDAIVIDESFWGFGYDYRSGKPDGLSKYMIPFQLEVHRLIRSYGKDKALLTSDCSYTSFVLWSDGEAGDHENLWRMEYRKPPVRYLAALGDKRWLPCLWRPVEWWEYQMDLARKTGAGVALSNGWMEYAGLTAQPPAIRARLLADIKQLRHEQNGEVHLSD